jgi:DNA-binding NarL/FixJ family response regulator
LHPTGHFHCRRDRGDSGARSDLVIGRIRIVAGDLPQLAAEMVERAVDRQGDMALVGTATSLRELVALARRTKPDVVVVGLHDHELSQDYLELLFDQPRTRVLGIAAHDGRAYLYELRPEQVELGEVSPDDVVASIRHAARRPARS